MGKIEWKPGNMLYPLPVVMVTVADEAGNDNIIMGGNGLHQPSYGINFGKTGAVFLCNAM